VRAHARPHARTHRHAGAHAGAHVRMRARARMHARARAHAQLFLQVTRAAAAIVTCDSMRPGIFPAAQATVVVTRTQDTQLVLMNAMHACLRCGVKFAPCAEYRCHNPPSSSPWGRVKLGEMSVCQCLQTEIRHGR
jgi:hypothetical protein